MTILIRYEYTVQLYVTGIRIFATRDIEDWIKINDKRPFLYQRFMFHYLFTSAIFIFLFFFCFRPERLRFTYRFRYGQKRQWMEMSGFFFYYFNVFYLLRIDWVVDRFFCEGKLETMGIWMVNRRKIRISLRKIKVNWRKIDKNRLIKHVSNDPKIMYTTFHSSEVLSRQFHKILLLKLNFHSRKRI